MGRSTAVTFAPDDVTGPLPNSLWQITFRKASTSKYRNSKNIRVGRTEVHPPGSPYILTPTQLHGNGAEACPFLFTGRIETIANLGTFMVFEKRKDKRRKKESP